MALSCLNNFQLSNGNCVPCTTSQSSICQQTCSGYGSGYYLATTCTLCAYGAATCSSLTVALSCSNGFFLSSSNCVACGLNVQSCSSYLVPSTCNSGYSIISTVVGTVSTSSCVKCPGGASACTSTNVATTCLNGFFLSNVIILNIYRK